MTSLTIMECNECHKWDNISRLVGVVYNDGTSAVAHLKELDMGTVRDVGEIFLTENHSLVTSLDDPTARFEEPEEDDGEGL